MGCCAPEIKRSVASHFGAQYASRGRCAIQSRPFSMQLHLSAQVVEYVGASNQSEEFIAVQYCRERLTT